MLRRAGTPRQHRRANADWTRLAATTRTARYPTSPPAARQRIRSPTRWPRDRSSVGGRAHARAPDLPLHRLAVGIEESSGVFGRKAGDDAQQAFGREVRLLHFQSCFAKGGRQRRVDCAGMQCDADRMLVTASQLDGRKGSCPGRECNRPVYGSRVSYRRRIEFTDTSFGLYAGPKQQAGRHHDQPHLALTRDEVRTARDAPLIAEVQRRRRSTTQADHPAESARVLQLAEQRAADTACSAKDDGNLVC